MAIMPDITIGSEVIACVRISQECTQARPQVHFVNGIGETRSKKKRGGLRLLSGVEVSELRLWWTAVPPRPSQLRPDPQLSAPGVRSRDFYSRLSLSTSFGLPTPPARASFIVGFPGLRPFRLPVLPARAFRSVGPHQPKLLSDLSIFPSRSPS
jgi:hypothetical protein